MIQIISKQVLYANLEDDEDVIKEQDQKAIGEQLIQEQTEAPDLAEQQVNKDQQGVPNPAVPRNEQDDQVEDEQNINQVSDPVSTTVPQENLCPNRGNIKNIIHLN